MSGVLKKSWHNSINGFNFGLHSRQHRNASQIGEGGGIGTENVSETAGTGNR